MNIVICVLLYFGSGSGVRFAAAFLLGIRLSPESKNRHHNSSLTSLWENFVTP
jgi:hypothetical protein